MSSATEQIKERLPIADVVSSYLKLERAGGNFKARCPFHAEKTPSFIVSPARNTYHCFGCNKGGDIFSFVEEIEGVDFKKALEVLADRAGIALERVDPRLKSEEARLYSALEESTKFFEENLKGSVEAKSYLAGRGLSEASIKLWRVGYAKDEWRHLLAHLRAKKFTDAEIEKAGLSIKSEKGYYDRFRGRIMFPVSGTTGKIIGFSGRFFSSEGKKEEGAKYINTPETPLYHKGKALYGLSQARTEIVKKDFSVLVEGQMDLLMAHQSGIQNAVATSGTALTEEHLKILKRLSDKLVMAFDPDEAGLAASERAFNMALLEGIEVRIAKLPKGIDPAELAKDTPERLKAEIEGAKHIVDFYLESLVENGVGERTLKLEVSKRVLPFLALVRNRIDQAHFVSKIAKVLNIKEEPVWEELEKASAKILDIKDNLSPPSISRSREELIREKILSIIYWQEDEPKEARVIDINKTKERYKLFSVGNDKVPRGGKEGLILRAEVSYKGKAGLDKELEELFLHLEQIILEGKFNLSMNALRGAETKGDEKLAAEKLEECNDISKRINEIKKLIVSI